MATIQKRKNKNGTYSYRVMIRKSDGFPNAYKTLPTREEAKDWARDEETRRRQGAYFPDQLVHKHTVSELIDRYIAVILPIKPKDARNTRRHLEWWRQKLGKYSVKNITPNIIAEHRQKLLKPIG